MTASISRPSGSHRSAYLAPPVPAPAPAARLAVVALLLLLGGLLAIGLAQPKWLAPLQLTDQAFEVGEASLRLAMVRERQRVEIFRSQNGRLPSSLEEAGGTVAGLRYLPSPDGSYALEADYGRSSIRLASTNTVEAFLGKSLEVLLSHPAG